MPYRNRSDRCLDNFVSVSLEALTLRKAADRWVSWERRYFMSEGLVQNDQNIAGHTPDSTCFPSTRWQFKVDQVYLLKLKPMKSSGWVKVHEVLRMSESPWSLQDEWKSMEVFRMSESPWKSLGWVKVNASLQDEWKSMQVFRMSESPCKSLGWVKVHASL